MGGYLTLDTLNSRRTSLIEPLCRAVSTLAEGVPFAVQKKMYRRREEGARTVGSYVREKVADT